MSAADATVAAQSTVSVTPDVATVTIASTDAVISASGTASATPLVATVTIDAAALAVVEPVAESSYSGSGYANFQRRALIAQIMREEEELLALLS